MRKQEDKCSLRCSSDTNKKLDTWHDDERTDLTVSDLPIYDFYDDNDHKYYLFTDLEKEYWKLFL
jgi:hypothetical protein